MLKIFSNLSQPELCHIALVCKHWLWLVYDSELWKYVDLSRFKKISEAELVNLIQARLSPLLKTLNLSNCEITPIVLHELTDNCQQLGTLVLHNSKFKVDESEETSLEEIVKKLPVPDKLVRLDIRNLNGGYQFVHALLQAHDMSQLKCFGFGNSCYCPTFCDFQSTFHKMNSLCILECVDCEFLNDEKLQVIADNLLLLESISLKKCRKINGATLKYLLENAKNLTSLNLSDTNISDEALINCTWNNCIVQELDLSFCDHLTNVGLTESITNCSKLKYLALNKVGRAKAVTAEMFEKVFELENWFDLQILSLSFCTRLSYDFFPFLEFSKLNRVSLRTCHQIKFRDIVSNIKYFSNIVALECGSLFSHDRDNGWIEMIETFSIHCKQLKSLVLVKCSPIPVSKLSNYKKVVKTFIEKCSNLQAINIMYSEKGIFELFEICVDECNMTIEVSTSLTVNTIPPFKKSLDSDINQQQFRTYFPY